LPSTLVELYDARVISRLALPCCALLLAVSLSLWFSPFASAQTPAAQETERERQFVEALRREDPAEAERFVALNEARARAIDELHRAEAQYNAAGPELRAAFSTSLRGAQRKYAEASLALLDFFDARERRAIARYQEEIQRVQRSIDDRQKTRADLQKLLGK
jgi:hypothetical protein